MFRLDFDNFIQSFIFEGICSLLITTSTTKKTGINLIKFENMKKELCWNGLVLPKTYA